MSASRYDLSGKENLGSHIDIQSGRSVQRLASFPEQGNAIYQQENTNVVPLNVIKYPTDLQREDYQLRAKDIHEVWRKGVHILQRKNPQNLFFTLNQHKNAKLFLTDNNVIYFCKITTKNGIFRSRRHEMTLQY